MVDGMSARLTSAGRKVDALKGKAREASTAMDGLDKASEKVRQTISKLAAAFTAKELVSKIANVRGEFQQLEVAFNTMLGSEEKANELMAQLVKTAATTPFDLQGVAQGAKQLLAYGENVANVNDDLIRLGNIAAGLSQPLNDIVYLYGTTMTQGRLYTQDLNQFTGRGIPMIRELANVLGIAEDKVKETVEAGKVGFPEVQKVIQNLTNEGGMFYNLMEEQSKTITGQIANIEDAISTMFNEIGQQNEGVINTVLSGVSSMVENYEQVGRVLAAVATTYGTYKTAVMLATAAEGWATATEAIHYNWLLLLEKAQKLLNKTMLANPYVLVATAVAGVVAALVSMKTETERMREAEKEYQDAKQETINKEEEHIRKMQELCDIAGDEAVATDTRREALNKLEMKYPDIFAKYDTEYEKLKNIKKIKEEIAALEAGKSITQPKNELAEVEKRIKELEKKAKTVRYTTYNTSAGAYTVKTGGLSSKEEAELKNLRNKRTNLQGQVKKNNANAYFANLTGVSNEDLKKMINERTTLLAKMSQSGKKYGKVQQGNATQTGSYNADELKYQLNKLKAEQNERNAKRDSSADWGKSAKKKYQDALKEYNDFLNKSSNNLTQAEYEKKRKELKDALDTAKKEYDASKPSEDKEATKAHKREEKEQRDEERRVQARTELGEKERALELENQEEEIDLMDEGREKKLKQIDKEYQQRAAEIEKKAHDLAEANKKAGETNVNGNGLTAEQQTEIDKANALNEKSKAKQESDLVKADAEAMREYLKQYGTYQQQKLAIAEEYAEKIAKAESEGEKKTLEAERDSALRGVDVEAIKQSVDWGSVMGDFGTMFKDQVQPTIDKLRAIAGSESFKESSLENQQALYELISKLEQSGAAWDSDIFKKVSADITAYQSAMKGYTSAVEREKSASDDLAAAKERLAAAEKSGEGKEEAQAAVETAQSALDAASADVKNFGTQVTETTASLQSSSEKAKNMFENLASGLEGLASGSLKGVGSGVMTLDKLFGGDLTKTAGNALAKGFQGLLGKDSAASKAITEALGDTGLAGDIISAVLGMLDLIAENGISGIITSLQDTILGSVNKILDDVLSGDIITKPLKSAVSGVGSILDTVSFGGWSSLTGAKESDKHLAEDIEKLNEQNENLADAINRLAEVMSEATVAKSQELYEQQKAALAQSEKNTQEEMYRSVNAWKDGGLFHSDKDSSRKKIRQGISQDEWQQVADVLGDSSFMNLSDDDKVKRFFSLSSEEMYRVSTDAAAVYEHIKELANDGYKDAAQYMDTYISYYTQAEELADSMREKLTGVSFDTVQDNFSSMLKDMSSDLDDFSEDMEEKMLDAVVEGMMSDKYTEKLRAWYNEFADAMSDGLTEAEAEKLRAEYKAITEEAIEERDALLDASGVDADSGTSQTGKSGSFSAMTQDQGTKLEGMFTSGLQHWSSMDARLEDVGAKMNVAEGHLAKIEENTGVSASHLNEIKEDLKKVIRDGLKVK